MTPFETAADVYQREPCASAFEHDLFLHLMHGTVISTPEVFAMLRPVQADWPLDRWRNPADVAQDGDTWWIYCAAGEVWRLFDMLPVKKWLAFERGNCPRFREYERLRRLYASPSLRSPRPRVAGFAA